MEPSQGKPGRKRRRWLIVVAVLALVPCAWWYWPRGDARFVGRWEWIRENSRVPEMVVTLYSSGTAEITDLRSATPSTTTTWWRVRYNCLCFGFDRRSDWYDVMLRASDTVIDVLGLNFEAKGHGHLILDDSNPDEIRLSTWMILNGDPNILLRRRNE